MHIGIHFEHWDVYAMYASILVILGFEFLGVFGDRYITITHIIRQYIPLWARWPIIAWLAWHFRK